LPQKDAQRFVRVVEKRTTLYTIPAQRIDFPNIPLTGDNNWSGGDPRIHEVRLTVNTASGEPNSRIFATMHVHIQETNKRNPSQLLDSILDGSRNFDLATNLPPSAEIRFVSPASSAPFDEVTGEMRIHPDAVVAGGLTSKARASDNGVVSRWEYKVENEHRVTASLNPIQYEVTAIVPIR
jgi:hypothetical protein